MRRLRQKALRALAHAWAQAEGRPMATRAERRAVRRAYSRDDEPAGAWIPFTPELLLDMWLKGFGPPINITRVVNDAALVAIRRKAEKAEPA